MKVGRALTRRVAGYCEHSFLNPIIFEQRQHTPGRGAASALSRSVIAESAAAMLAATSRGWIICRHDAWGKGSTLNGQTVGQVDIGALEQPHYGQADYKAPLECVRRFVMVLLLVSGTSGFETLHCRGTGHANHRTRFGRAAFFRMGCDPAPAISCSDPADGRVGP